MRENEKALNHVKQFIESLRNNCSLDIQVEATEYNMTSFAYRIRVRIIKSLHVIQLERSIIDDLEVALEKYRKTTYFNSLESSIKFTIYIQLGREGMLSDFNISQELINDQREWINDYKVDLQFDEEMTQVLYKGLKNLTEVFSSQIKKHILLGIEISEIEENKKWVQSIIDYYDSNQHLNSPGVRIRNLQYLKAAAVKYIMDLEELRRNEKQPTTRKALNRKIYDIVIQLRKDPFLDVELPAFVHDISVAQG